MFLYTIPNATIICMIITALIAIGVPIVLPIIIHKKTKQKWTVFLVGAAIWVIFALVLEGALNNSVVTRTNIQSNLWVYAVYGAFAAGIFEETGRFIAFKYVLKKHREPETALMYGAGHGGIESIILVGLTMISNITAAIMINSGTLANLISDPTKLQATLNQMQPLSTAVPAVMLLGGAERILAIALQLAFSVIVFKAVKENKIGYFILAILLHAFVDFGAVVLTHYIVVWQYELILLVEVIVIGWFTIKLYRDMKLRTPFIHEPVVNIE